MDVNQEVFYGETLYDFEAYLDRLIAKAMEPYAFQLRGRWEASIIKEKVEFVFADFWNGGRQEKETEKMELGFRSAHRGSEAEAAQAICGIVSEEIYQHFLESEKRPFYVIDFMVFHKDIENKLRNIKQHNINN